MTAAAALADDWNEADHPRVPAGSPEGGEFGRGGGGGEGEGEGEGLASSGEKAERDAKHIAGLAATIRT